MVSINHWNLIKKLLQAFLRKSQFCVLGPMWETECGLHSPTTVEALARRTYIHTYTHTHGVPKKTLFRNGGGGLKTCKFVKSRGHHYVHVKAKTGLHNIRAFPASCSNGSRAYKLAAAPEASLNPFREPHATREPQFGRTRPAVWRMICSVCT
jgi:hypothetical protein